MKEKQQSRTEEKARGSRILIAVVTILMLTVSSCRKPQRGDGGTDSGAEKPGRKSDTVTPFPKPGEKGETPEKETDAEPEAGEEKGAPAPKDTGGSGDEGAKPETDDAGTDAAKAKPVTGGPAANSEIEPGKVEREETLPITLPADRVFKDSEGRELDATVIGRNSLQLTVIRRVDGARFDLPIANLSVEDQAWARTLAFQAAPIQRPMKEAIAEVVEEPAYVKSRRELIGRLELKIRRLKAEIKASSNDILKKSARDRMKDAEQEIEELEADIELYEVRTGIK